MFPSILQRTKDLDTPDLLEQLPALQQLLYRVIGCQVIFYMVNYAVGYLLLVVFSII